MLNDYLITVGKLIHNGAIAEGYLFGSFRILSGCEAKLAVAIFYSLDALQAKKSLLKRVVEAVGDEEDAKLVEKIILAAEKSNKQRQKVSHAILSHVDPKHTELRLLRPKAGQEVVPLTKEYVKNIMDNSVDADNEGRKAFNSLCKKHGVPPTPGYV